MQDDTSYLIIYYIYFSTIHLKPIPFQTQIQDQSTIDLQLAIFRSNKYQNTCSSTTTSAVKA